MRVKIAAIIGLGLLLAVLTAGCAAKSKAAVSPGGEAVKDLTRTDNSGGVQVTVTWATPEYFKTMGKQEMVSQLDLKNRLVFNIGMTTHSGDLGSYQYLKNSELVVDGARFKPLNWESLSQDSHHPEGYLIFSAKDSGGKPIISGQAKSVELILRDLNNVPERKFQWPANASQAG